MSLELPKFHETFNPILDILSDGKIIHTREMQEKVIQKYYSNLPKELLDEKTKSGEILINNRIAWGKSYLKKGGYIHYPERGHVQITEKGLNQKSGLTLKEVEEDSNILNFYTEENSKQGKEVNPIEKIKNASPQDLIDEGFNEIELEVKNELLTKLKNIDFILQ